MNEVLPVIIATAGHVDHGKTALVEALTGCNTDRLPQERQRGLSIDIGFASCPLDRDSNVGIVDLPGHEDFIKNMAAGAASADILLLIVAADESVMPQTREHLEIVAQLTVAKIILVITKIDLVSAEYREVAAAAGCALLAEYGLSAQQVHYTSVRTLEGLSGLREGIRKLVSEQSLTADNRDFRVFVERTFHSKGHGIVVTGIPVSGEIGIGDYLKLQGEQVRVRGIESYGRRVELGVSGGCLALNIDFTAASSGVHGIKRGAVLCHDSYKPSAEFIVQVHCIANEFSYKRVLKCRLHVGTLALNASLKFFGSNLPESGETVFAHLKLDKESVLAAGDRFLLRGASPVGNIAGGRVLSAEGGYRLSNKDCFRMSLFTQAAEAIAEEDYLFSELLAGERYAVSRRDLSELGHMSGERLQGEISKHVNSGILCRLALDFWLVAAKVEELAQHFVRRLQDYHSANEYRSGMAFELAAEILRIPVEGIEAAVKLLAENADIVSADGVVRCADFKPKLEGRSLAMYSVVAESLEHEPGYWLPLGEIKDRFMVTNRESQQVIRLFVTSGSGVILGGKYLVAAEEVRRLEEILLQGFTQTAVLDIPRWRSLSGLGRNHAVAVLEYFDDKGVTRRVAEGRELMDNN